jgi:CheY-like chemotaxis protein
MDAFESFKQQLQVALAHLHDPAYQFPMPITLALGCLPEDPACLAQSRLIERIESLAGDRDSTPGSRLLQAYEVLHRRYVLGLTQEEAALGLSMSLRSIQRAQPEAAHLLARRLWETLQAGPPAPHGADDWRSQVKHELLALQQGLPEAWADLDAVIQGVLRVAGAAARGRAEVSAGRVDPGLRVAVHPAALRQILLSVISRLQEGMTAGRITVTAVRSGTTVRVTVEASPRPANLLLDLRLADELLGAPGRLVEQASGADRVAYTLDLPVVEEREHHLVLAIDDNVDLGALYRSFCAGTAYELEHLRAGAEALEKAAALKPDLILLDVMLPDVDGWDLLLDLHANPETREIPVIVCSVIPDEQLALDLGARLYLRKPVWRELLIETFDRMTASA